MAKDGQNACNRNIDKTKSPRMDTKMTKHVKIEQLIHSRQKLKKMPC